MPSGCKKNLLKYSIFLFRPSTNDDPRTDDFHKRAKRNSPLSLDSRNRDNKHALLSAKCIDAIVCLRRVCASVRYINSFLYVCLRNFFVYYRYSQAQGVSGSPEHAWSII